MNTEFSILFKSVKKKYSIFKGKLTVYLVGYEISQDIIIKLRDNFPEYEFFIADPKLCPDVEEGIISALYFYGIGIPVEYDELIKKIDYEIINHDEIILSTPIKYNDSYGNSVICDSPGYEISIKGGGNNVVIKNSSTNNVKCQIKITSFCNICIEPNKILRGIIIAEDYTTVKIGNNVIGQLKIASHDHGQISIGENSTVGNTIFDLYNPYSEIIVGKDCMFSEETECISGDGHPIYDLNTRLLKARKKSLVIGNHVWIGRRAMILNNAKIGDGSIVGACSLVTGSFPNNCIIAGNPAKVIKDNISWARAIHGDIIEYCNGYICKTGDFKEPNLMMNNETLRNSLMKLVESRNKSDRLLLFNEFLKISDSSNEYLTNDQIKNIIYSESDSFYYSALVAFEYYYRISNISYFYNLLDIIVNSQKNIDKKIHLSMLASNAYNKGNGVASDLKKAALWARRAYDYGADWASDDLINILWRLKTPETDSEMIELVKPLSESGSKVSQAYMARAYRDGRGVPKDYEKAAELMRKASGNKIEWADWELFDILYRMNTAESLSEAISIAKPLEESGNREFIARMGRAYRDGKGVEKDLTKAADLMRSAYSKGLSWAGWELFDILWSLNTKEADTEMISIAEPQTKKGNREFEIRMGRAYRRGRGVGKDLDKAQDFMQRSITHGLEQAKKELNEIKIQKMTEKGSGIVIFDVSHYMLLYESILLRANRHKNDCAILLITKKNGKDKLISRLLSNKVFDHIIEYDPYYATLLNDESAIISSIKLYFDDLLKTNGLQINDVKTVYSGADLIDNFFIYLNEEKVSTIIMESLKDQLKYTSRITAARKMKMVSETYGYLQENTGFIDASNPITAILRYADENGPDGLDSFNIKIETEKLSEEFKKRLSGVCNINESYDGSDVLLMNSKGHCAYESGLDEKHQIVIYRTLVDFFSSSKSILIKNHPESPTDVSNLIVNGKIMDDFPVELLSSTTVRFNKAISIDTGASMKMKELGLVKESVMTGVSFYRDFIKMPLADFIVDLAMKTKSAPDVSGIISSDLFSIYVKNSGKDISGSDNVLRCTFDEGTVDIDYEKDYDKKIINMKLELEKSNERSMDLFKSYSLCIHAPQSLCSFISNYNYSKELKNLGIRYTVKHTSG